MPVTTQTFRNLKKMNVWFFVSSMILLLSVIWAVLQDHHREYRAPQEQLITWETARTGWQTEVDRFRRDSMNYAGLVDQRNELTAKLDADPAYQALNRQIADLTVDKDEKAHSLQLFVDGNIAPMQQRVERDQALLSTITGTAAAKALLAEQRNKLDYFLKQKTDGENQIKAWEKDLEDLKAKKRTMEAGVAAVDTKIKAATGAFDKAHSKLEQLNPGWWGDFGNWLRDQPLLDAFNDDVKIQQQLVPGVLTDVNLTKTKTIDRCMSCHVTISNAAYSEANVLKFLEYQVSMDKKEKAPSAQEILDRQSVHPIALVEFWENIDRAIPSESGAPGREMNDAGQQMIRQYAVLMDKADAKGEIRSRYKSSAGDQKVTTLADAKQVFNIAAQIWPSDWKQWYTPMEFYRLTLQDTAKKYCDKDEWRATLDCFRHELIDAYNARSRQKHRGELSSSRLMLAHPDLDLYCDPDSKHPVLKFGCTVCHDGSGEETQFEHTAHTPSRIWVDGKSGMLLPDFLVKHSGTESQIIRDLHESGSSRQVERRAAPSKSGADTNGEDRKAAVQPANKNVVLASLTTATVSAQESSPKNESAASVREPGSGPAQSEQGASATGHAVDFHANEPYADYDEYKGHAFGPENVPEDVVAAVYTDPLTGEATRAIWQEQSWKEHFGWVDVEYPTWEHPMSELKYVEASCNRCHTQEMELTGVADTLVKGRMLFTELGCVDCHAVDSLGSTLRGEKGLPDVKQVGPNLTHVRDKMSEDMIASWTFAPKAFRPNTRMPHFWLQENNSSPIDVRRSRAEVSAIAYYLTHYQSKDAPPYSPAPVPDDPTTGKPMVGDASAGRELFKTVGCLACHANVEETGLDWVTLDVQERFGLDKEGALKKIATDCQENLKSSEGVETPDANLGFFNLDQSGQPTHEIIPDQYNRLQWYLMEYESDRYSIIGPDLSGEGTKLTAGGRTDAQAEGWIYDWLQNPSHYSSYTIMPRFRLSPQETVNLAAYLLTQKRPDYKVEHFAPDEPMMDALLVNLQKNAISEQAARDIVSHQTLAQKRMDLGQRMIQHYGCFGCHEVPGFDSKVAVSANLSAFGSKDPHKLDFGYFEQVFVPERPTVIDQWLSPAQGLASDAIHITADDIGPDGLHKVPLKWEDVHIDRRGYLYSKLHNTRIFDRNKLGLDGAMTDQGEIILTDTRTRTKQVVERDGKIIDLATGKDSGLTLADTAIADVGEPYLKLRMPRFYLRDSDVVALTTYVTSLKDPLVEPFLQKTTDKYGEMRANGRLMANTFNCFGCHDVENNYPTIAQYFEVRKPDGSLDYLQTVAQTENRPPRIVGNGAKVNHDWFFSFLNNVQMIRPWLKIRMPSFNLTEQQTKWLVEYLAGDAGTRSETIAAHLHGVDKQLGDEFTKVYDEEFRKALAAHNGEAQADVIAKAAAARAVGKMLEPDKFAEARQSVLDMAKGYELYPPTQYIDRSMSQDEKESKYGQMWYDMRFLEKTYSGVNYPFQEPADTTMSDLDFARGEALVDKLNCFSCHRLGDWTKLEQIFEIQQKELEQQNQAQPEDDNSNPYGEDSGSENDNPYGADDTSSSGSSDDNPYGASTDETAKAAQPAPPPEKPTLFNTMKGPNLAAAYKRLQVQYLHQWLRKPSTIMPNTNMPNNWGPDGTVSAFATYPPEAREDAELRFGKTADEQIDLVIRWILAAGERGYTNGAETLEGPSGTAAAQRRANDAALIEQYVKEQKAKAAGEAPVPAPSTTSEPAANSESGKPSAAPAAAEVNAPAKNESPEKPKVEPSVALTPAQQKADREDKVSKVIAGHGNAAGTGSIAGVVIYEGSAKPRRIRVTDAACIAKDKELGIVLTDPKFELNANGSIRDTLVYIKNPPAGMPVPADLPVRQIAQEGCEYVPHITDLTVGQKLNIINDDSFAHNLNYQSLKNGSFNASQPVKGMIQEFIPRNAEMDTRLKCDVHSWMNSLIDIFDHPFHTTTNADGVYIISGLPAGEYDLVFHHEVFGDQTLHVKVEAGKTLEQDVTFGK